jgi:hypothetical protein
LIIGRNVWELTNDVVLGSTIPLHRGGSEILADALDDYDM